jgi:hypothetical protein
MQEVDALFEQLSQPWILWVACVIGALFISLIVFDAIRRRRRQGRSRSSSRAAQPNAFKRAGDSFRVLREELRRRKARKTRDRDRDK